MKYLLGLVIFISLNFVFSNAKILFIIYHNTKIEDSYAYYSF
jgi:hypothetical protein